MNGYSASSGPTLDAGPEGGTVTATFTLDPPDGMAVAGVLGECLDPIDTALTLTPAPGGAWTVRLHFSSAPDEDAVRMLVETVAGCKAASSLGFDTVLKRDWVADSLAGLPPVNAGRFTVHGAHDRQRAAHKGIAIEVEAGLAFGTGHHGTTLGCLLALDHLLKSHRPDRIIDLGTGTGILAIAAAKALRRRIIAVDIDPTAVAVAKENARANRVLPYLSCVCANGLSAREVAQGAPYSLVFANILLAPLIRLATPISQVTAPGATLILSGLLKSHADSAVARYRTAGFKLVRRWEIEGWTTLQMAFVGTPLASTKTTRGGGEPGPENVQCWGQSARRRRQG